MALWRTALWGKVAFCKRVGTLGNGGNLDMAFMGHSDLLVMALWGRGGALKDGVPLWGKNDALKVSFWARVELSGRCVVLQE